MSSARPELIFVHIPKTAGSSFEAILKAVYGSEQVKRWRRDNAGSFDDLRKWPRVISGHFPLGKYAPAFPDAATITWLREPAARLFSMYFYFRNPPTPRAPITALRKAVEHDGISLEEFVELCPKNPFTDRFLRGYSLADLDFVGITEHFADDLRDLAQKLSWPDVHVARERVTVTGEYKHFHPSSRLLRRIRELHHDDIELYEEALELRRSRLASLKGAQ